MREEGGDISSTGDPLHTLQSSQHWLHHHRFGDGSTEAPRGGTICLGSHGCHVGEPGLAPLTPCLLWNILQKMDAVEEVRERWPNCQGWEAEAVVGSGAAGAGGV